MGDLALGDKRMNLVSGIHGGTYTFQNSPPTWKDAVVLCSCGTAG